MVYIWRRGSADVVGRAGYVFHVSRRGPLLRGDLSAFLRLLRAGARTAVGHGTARRLVPLRASGLAAAAVAAAAICPLDTLSDRKRRAARPLGAGRLATWLGTLTWRRTVKRFVTFACRGLAIYFGTLALTLFLADTLRGRAARAWDPVGSDPTATAGTLPGGGGCPACREEWRTTSELYDGMECEHGPEHDPNCPGWDTFNPWVDCVELNGDKPASNGKICRCADCKPGCEREIIQFLAWCGPGAGAACGYVEPRGDPMFWRFTRRSIPVPGRQPCSSGGPGATFIPLCGYPTIPVGEPPSSMPPIGFVCKTSDCMPDLFDPWRPNIGDVMGPPYRCAGNIAPVTIPVATVPSLPR